MTHDQMIAALRGLDWPIFDPEDHHAIADRLDRYRDALIRIVKHDRYGISPEMQIVVKAAREALK
jgi:hypothetical protein